MRNQNQELCRSSGLPALLTLAILIAGCSGSDAPAPDEAVQTTDDAGAASTAVSTADAHVAELAADMQFCRIPDPTNPSSAFNVSKSEVTSYDNTWMDNYWVQYTCKETCTDWRECAAPAHEPDGDPIRDAREPDGQKQALAFVTDGMGGHIAFSSEGDENSIYFHGGAGGTTFYSEIANYFEERTSAKTVMVRWEGGFRPSSPDGEMDFPWSWGWYSRTSAGATDVPALNRRVASTMAFTSQNLSGSGGFNTMGCSMGTVATFGPVLWHGLDDLIDYQVLVGGPPMYDMNAGCNMETYTEGFCDLDANVACTTNADCASAGETAVCSVPTQVSIPHFSLYQSLANHVHATNACRDGVTEPYAPFDASGMKYATDGDWDIDHSIDMFVDVQVQQDFEKGQGGGDEHWGLGHFGPVFLDMNMAEGSEKRWIAVKDSNHCESFENEEMLQIMLSNLVLK